MAQVTQVMLVDDLDGGVGHETVSFGIGADAFEIDLSSAHARALREAVAPFIAAAREVDPPSHDAESEGIAEPIGGLRNSTEPRSPFEDPPRATAGVDLRPPGDPSVRKRRAEILDAAAQVFREKGYATSTIQDIAEVVGILKGSLYYYIKSKEDLLYDILEGLHQEAFERIEKALSQETGTMPRLRALIIALFTFHTDNLTRISIMFSDFRLLSPDRQQAIIKERDRYDSLLRALVLQGQAEGLIRSDLDPKITAFAILGMVNWMYHWYRPGGEYTAVAIAECYATIALDGITIKRPPTN